MPYNFLTGNYEFLDYKKLVSDINNSLPSPQSPEYLTQIGFTSFFIEWCKFLGAVDTKTLNFFKDKDNVQKVNEQLQTEPEFYQYSIPIGNQNLRWSLQIEPIISDLHEFKKTQIVNIPYQDFLRTDSKYLWEATSDVNIKTSNHNQPLILIKLPVLPEKYLVVDGNHRLTKFSKSSGKTKAVILPAALVACNSYYFPSQFDQWVFTYFIDQMTIFNRIYYHHVSSFPFVNSDWFTSKFNAWFNNK